MDLQLERKSFYQVDERKKEEHSHFLFAWKLQVSTMRLLIVIQYFAKCPNSTKKHLNEDDGENLILAFKGCGAPCDGSCFSKGKTLHPLQQLTISHLHVLC